MGEDAGYLDVWLVNWGFRPNQVLAAYRLFDMWFRVQGLRFRGLGFRMDSGLGYGNNGLL